MKRLLVLAAALTLSTAHARTLHLRIEVGSDLITVWRPAPDATPTVFPERLTRPYSVTNLLLYLNAFGIDGWRITTNAFRPNRDEMITMKREQP